MQANDQAKRKRRQGTAHAGPGCTPPYGKGYMGTKGPAREVIFGRAAKFQISKLPKIGCLKRMKTQDFDAETDG